MLCDDGARQEVPRMLGDIRPSRMGKAPTEIRPPGIDRRKLLASAGAAGLTFTVAPAALSQGTEPATLERPPGTDLLDAELAENRAKAERILADVLKDRPPREGLIEATAPDLAEDGSVVPVSFKVNCSMTGDDYPRTVHVIGMVNPFPEIARYHFTPACGEAEAAFRCRMRASSNLVFVADMADGTVGITTRFVTITVGACSDEGGHTVRRGERRRLKVPKTAERGEVIEVKSLAEHIMESGRRRHFETGELLPRFIIKRVECRYSGELVFVADWFNGVSANPYLSFKLRAVDSGTVQVTWVEDDETATVASAEVEVVDPADS